MYTLVTLKFYLVYDSNTHCQQIIAGFTVDTLDAFLFFAEGLAEDISAEVWNIVFSLQTSQGFVLYNSDLSFGQVKFVGSSSWYMH